MFDDFFNADLQDRARKTYNRLNAAAEGRWETTAVQETRKHRDPLRTLLSSMLSARTKEEDTRQATDQLFALASTPTDILALTDDQIEAAIRPVTYHGSKVGYVRGICEQLLSDHDGNVPRDLDALTALPGVGWKTATLTQWIAFGIAEEICVDVHVTRIGKRLGLVNPKTTKPQAVSKELMKIVPEDLWGVWNPMMVRFGREVCYYNDPNCAGCPLADFCPQVDVN